MLVAGKVPSGAPHAATWLVSGWAEHGAVMEYTAYPSSTGRLPFGKSVQVPRMFWAQSSMLVAASQARFAVAVPSPLFVKELTRGDGIRLAPVGRKAEPVNGWATSKKKALFVPE